MRFQQKHNFNAKSGNFFLFLILIITLTCTTSIFSQKKYVVVIDAGHGGKDPGNLGNGFVEKHIALKVALAVGKKITNSTDVKVIYTRTKDTYPPLWKRGEIANNSKADLFVSIHCDSHTNNAYGAGTFVLGLRGNKKNLEIAKRENASILLEENYQERYKGFDENSVESVIGLSLLQEENLDKSLEIASLIQNNFVSIKRNDRKVKQDNFQVLRETIMPSVLVELGFLTNKIEGRYLNSTKGQTQMATAIAEAILKYINNLKINTIVATTDTVIPLNITETVIDYKIQIASSKKKLATKSYNFRGLKGVHRQLVKPYYKYYFGQTNDYEKVKGFLKLVKSRGYKSAFIVAFKNGEKISVNDAIKMQ